MKEAVKSKSKARRHEASAHSERSETTHAVSTQSRGSKMQIAETDWDYEKVKEVVSAAYTIISLFLTKEQKARIDKVNTDVSAILGVNSLAEWTPPQPLLNIIGLEAGTQRKASRQGYSHAA